MAVFRGGIRFSPAIRQPENEAQPLQPFIPTYLTLSLRCEKSVLQPCVRNGDTVHIGQRLAEDPHGWYPPLHSGISGTVTALTNHQTSDGETEPVMRIDGNGDHTLASPLPPLSVDAAPETIVNRMFEAGLVGMGGGGFPTYLKYRDVHAHLLIINACECEPFLAGDVRLVCEQTDQLAQGARWLARAAGVPESGILLCTESAAAFSAFTRRDTGLRSRLLAARYPQGSERQLIYALRKQELATGLVPSRCGILVSNAATAVAMAEAAEGIPLTHRPVTVAGRVARPVNLLAPIGTPLHLLADAAVPLLGENERLYVAGGPMTGQPVSPGDGLRKNWGGLIILPRQSMADQSCIRCGGCVRVCPSGLTPFQIDNAFLLGDRDRYRALRADACIRCGCCSFICPARRPLSYRVGEAASLLKAEQRKGDAS